MISRRELFGLVASAGVALVEREPVRAYSFAPAGGWPCGIDAWLPDGDAEPFFGVNRAPVAPMFRDLDAITEQQRQLIKLLARHTVPHLMTWKYVKIRT